MASHRAEVELDRPTNDRLLDMAIGPQQHWHVDPQQHQIVQPLTLEGTALIAQRSVEGGV